MAAADAGDSALGPPSRAFALAICAGLVASFAGLASLPLLLLTDYPLWLAPLIPAAILGAAVFVWNTHAGLCFAAFAIAPLGIVQREIATVTFNLPEVLILMLFAKEAIRFVVHREAPAASLPSKTLAVYVAASLFAIATGLRHGNGAARALQDFRQFTEYVVLYLLVVYRVRSKRQAVQILACFLAGMSLVGFHGILQRFTGIGIPGHQILSDVIYHGDVRGGSFYGATPLSAMMVLSLGVAMGLAFWVRRFGARVILTGLACLCLAAAVFTYTRASWLAMFVVLVFIFASIRKTPAIVATVMAGALAFSIVLGALVVERLGTLEISRKERSVLERVRYYKAAWYIFRAYPLGGLGWGCYYDISPILANKRYVPVGQQDRLQKRAGSSKALRRGASSVATVHSAYLQLLVKTGLLGLATFLFFLSRWGALVWHERRQPDRAEREHRLFACLAGGLIGYLCHSGLENFFQWPVMAQSFWLLLGLSTVLAALIPAKNQEPADV